MSAQCLRVVAFCVLCFSIMAYGSQAVAKKPSLSPTESRCNDLAWAAIKKGGYTYPRYNNAPDWDGHAQVWLGDQMLKIPAGFVRETNFGWNETRAGLTAFLNAGLPGVVHNTREFYKKNVPEGAPSNEVSFKLACDPDYQIAGDGW